jgi:two-component system, OmpR family, sensor histidine kinase KdpD
LLQNQRDAYVSHFEPSAPRSIAKRGNLRIFFGGSAGFTAVRIMLETAAAVRQTGVDVVVGLMHAGHHSPFDRLLRSFECLPAPRDSPGAKQPARIDLDAARTRQPVILLVDTRVPPSSGNGCRARSGSVDSYQPWADIESILELGIHVWAAVDATGFSSWSSVGVGAAPRKSGLSLL